MFLKRRYGFWKVNVYIILQIWFLLSKYVFKPAPSPSSKTSTISIAITVVITITIAITITTTTSVLTSMTYTTRPPQRPGGNRSPSTDGLREATPLGCHRRCVWTPTRLVTSMTWSMGGVRIRVRVRVRVRVRQGQGWD